MKKIVKTVLLIIVIVFLGYMLFIIVQKVKQKQLITEQIKSLPKFSFKNVLNDNIFTNDSIVGGKACLIIYFHPDCEYCQYEVGQIYANIDKFKGFQILMISYAPKKEILAFREAYHLKKPFITFLQDPKFHFEDIFGNSPFPTSFIYNKNKRLVKQFKGEVKTEALLKYLAQ